MTLPRLKVILKLVGFSCVRRQRSARLGKSESDEVEVWQVWQVIAQIRSIMWCNECLERKSGVTG
jgi:hypothetical protein